MSGAPLLETIGLSKTFPGVKALNAVDFRLFPREIHTLMGQNGAGKSTLINLLTGVHEHDAGEIRLAGEPVNFATPLEAEAAALCAVRADEDDLAEIERKLDIMEDAFKMRAGMSSEEDWEFHQAIYRVSGNPLFEQIIAAMHELFHRFWEHPLGVRDFGHASFPYHRTIYQCIAARDPQGARAEALKLIATVEDDLKRGAAKLKLSSHT